MREGRTNYAQSMDDTTTSRSPQGWVWLWLLAALTGVVFTTIQIIEKITILKNPAAALICDVNSVMSCTDVLNAWQSSVLGPPNALIGAVMFAFLASGAVSALLHTSLSRTYIWTLWGLAVFFLCFATWFMFETAFAVGRLCIWCTGITTAVILICAALTRIVVRTGRLAPRGFAGALALTVRTGLDLVFWAGWWLVIAAFLAVGLTR